LTSAIAICRNPSQSAGALVAQHISRFVFEMNDAIRALVPSCGGREYVLPSEYIVCSFGSAELYCHNRNAIETVVCNEVTNDICM
jgi:hypothetical protein